MRGQCGEDPQGSEGRRLRGQPQEVPASTFTELPISGSGLGFWGTPDQPASGQASSHPGPGLQVPAVSQPFVCQSLEAVGSDVGCDSRGSSHPPQVKISAEGGDCGLPVGRGRRSAGSAVGVSPSRSPLGVPTPSDGLRGASVAASPGSCGSPRRLRRVGRGLGPLFRGPNDGLLRMPFSISM